MRRVWLCLLLGLLQIQMASASNDEPSANICSRLIDQHSSTFQDWRKKSGHSDYRVSLDDEKTLLTALCEDLSISPCVTEDLALYSNSDGSALIDNDNAFITYDYQSTQLIICSKNDGIVRVDTTIPSYIALTGRHNWTSIGGHAPSVDLHTKSVQLPASVSNSTHVFHSPETPFNIVQIISYAGAHFHLSANDGSILEIYFYDPKQNPDCTDDKLTSQLYLCLDTGCTEKGRHAIGTYNPTTKQFQLFNTIKEDSASEDSSKPQDTQENPLRC